VDEHDAKRALTTHRESTVARIVAMTAELADLAAASAGSNLDDEHDPEGSTVAFERAQLTAVLVQAREHLHDIGFALTRLAAAQYGLCEHCGTPISDERLAALPMARRCMACAVRPDA
jgi:RNA polymerase-binding transcription factor DksA